MCGRKYAFKFIQLFSSRPSGKGKRWFILVLQRLMLPQNVLCDYSLGTTVRRKGPAAQGLPVINCPLDKQICIACAFYMFSSCCSFSSLSFSVFFKLTGGFANVRRATWIQFGRCVHSKVSLRGVIVTACCDSHKSYRSTLQVTFQTGVCSPAQ